MFVEGETGQVCCKYVVRAELSVGADCVAPNDVARKKKKKRKVKTSIAVTLSHFFRLFGWVERVKERQRGTPGLLLPLSQLVFLSLLC